MVYTCLFYQIHESGSKTPRLVSVALQGADSHLGGTLRGHCYHVNSIIHQSCFSLHEKTERLSSVYNFMPCICFSLPRTISLNSCYGKGHYLDLHGNLRCRKKSFPPPQFILISEYLQGTTGKKATEKREVSKSSAGSTQVTLWHREKF